jgi:CheY-like chemotaxis protein
VIRVLIVEDDDADSQKASTIFQKIGLEVESMASVEAAEDLLERVAQGVLDPPDLIVLDLGFPGESGYAILRSWKSTPGLYSIPIVVWTQLSQMDCDLAELFGVSRVVRKSLGPAALESAVKHVVGI